VVPAIFLIDILAVGWPDSSLRSLAVPENRSSRSDAVCFALVHLRWMRPLQIALTAGLALISGEALRDLVETRLGLPVPIDFVPVPLLLPVCFALYTYLDYIAHRVDHWDLFWPLHRFHHAAASFNVLTADRGHPASVLTQSALKVFPMAVLGVPVDIMIDLGMIAAVINYFIHSRIDWDFGWFGRWVIVSPRHHRMHHALALVRPSNLGLVPLWDRLGGTWVDDPPGAIAIGVHDPYRHGAFIVPDLFRDYGAFLARLGQVAKRALGVFRLNRRGLGQN
jgi:sterol desaturase/sphingolipid hydroxylase (fatty acid hydroxylase superfamily)